MKLLRLTSDDFSIIYGGTGDKPGTITITTTPADLNNLVRPAGPVRPIPPHIDPERPVWIGPDEGRPFWARPNQPVRPQQQGRRP